MQTLTVGALIALTKEYVGAFSHHATSVLSACLRVLLLCALPEFFGAGHVWVTDVVMAGFFVRLLAAERLFLLLGLVLGSDCVCFSLFGVLFDFRV